MKLIFSLTLIVVSFAANIPTEKLKDNWKSYLKIDFNFHMKNRHLFVNQQIRNSNGVNVKFNMHDAHVIASEAPDSVDWRLKGAVTDVKNVGKCNGGSWSFAATGALESQQFLANGKLVPLSAQNLIDCVPFVDVEGCENGYADMGYWYIKQNGGIDTEESYPFEGEWKGECRFDKNFVGASVGGVAYILFAEEEILKKIVAKVGPVSVIIDGSHDSFKSYKGGIYFEPACRNGLESLNHAALLVGYGTDNETQQDYWLIRNSWGLGWGDKGYIKIARNKDNHCGVASQVSYPLV